MARSASSGRLRGWSWSARHEECDATNGCRATSVTCASPASERWLTSTIMRIRSIAAIAATPSC